MRNAALLLLMACPLSAQWAAFNRHGSILHNQQDCNLPGLINIQPGEATLTTEQLSTVCGVTDKNGWAWSAPQSYPWATAGMEWTSFSFLYGTLTVQAALPAQGTSTWPAIWLQGTECQRVELFMEDFGDGCPASGNWQNSDYLEIDLLECGGLAPWCQFAVYAGGGGPSTCSVSLTDTNVHTWAMTWSPTALTLSKDGTQVCSITGRAIPQRPMFLMIQTQVINATASQLPTALIVKSVQVTDVNNNVLFNDSFQRTFPPFNGQ